MDWVAWHDAYEQSGSPLAGRLRVVRERIRMALDEAPPGPLQVISVCAGQGRDLLPVLAAHSRRGDIRARLVELDERNASVAKGFVETQGLTDVEVVVGDASQTEHYLGIAPAHLVLLCGIFGNIADRDVERTVAYAGQLCATGASVVWTRHRNEPDLFPRICEWFESRGFARVWTSEPQVLQGVGAHRLIAGPRPLHAGERMFTFVGYDVLRGDRVLSQHAC